MKKRNKLLPLTETTYYILLALKEPSHGYQFMQTVEELSNGDVRIAAGTMVHSISYLKQMITLEIFFPTEVVKQVDIAALV